MSLPHFPAFKALFLTCLVSATQNLMAAVPAPVLVKNIHDGPALGQVYIRLSATLTAPAGGTDKALLVLADQEHGEELWLTDGTEGNLTLLKDINPGRQGSAIRELTPQGNRVFFLADDGVHGEELWLTDGTSAGTRLVADLTGEPGRGSNIRGIKPFKNGLMFAAESDLHPTALWFTDGTPAGTRVVKTLVAGDADAPDRFTTPDWLQAGGAFYFMLQPGGKPFELWKTDATATGTVLVKTFPVPKESIDPTPVLIGDLGGHLLFQIPREGIAFDLMKTNGTAKGTVKILGNMWDRAEPEQIAVKNGKGYFLVRTFDAGDYYYLEPWVTDGTAKGTKDFPDSSVNYEKADSKVTSAYQLRILGDNLILPVSENTFGPTLDIGSISLETGDFTWLLGLFGEKTDVVMIPVEGGESRMAVACRDADGRPQVVITDGTEAGNVTLTGFPYRGGLTALGSKLIYAYQHRPAQTDASDSSWGPAKLLSTMSGSSLTIDFLPTPDAGSSPRELQVLGDKLFFSAENASYGRELWQSDGTAEGTVLSIDITPGPYTNAGPQGPQGPQNLTVFKNHLFFTGSYEYYNSELLWRTPEGTLGHRLTDWPERQSAVRYPGNLYAAADRLFFKASTNTQGVELWATDVPFQISNISVVADLKPGTASSNPGRFIEMNGWLYFTAVSAAAPGTVKDVLWRLSLAPGAVPEEVFFSGAIGSPMFPSEIKELAVRPPAPGIYATEHVLYFTNGGHLYCCRNGFPIEYVKSSTVPIRNLLVENGIVYFSQNSPPVAPYSRGVFYQSSPSTFTPVTPAADCELLTVIGETVYYSGQTQTGEFFLECVQRDRTGRQRLFTAAHDPAAAVLHRDGTTLFYTCRTSATGPWTVWMTRGTPESTVEIPGTIRAGADVTLDNAKVLNNTLYFTAVHPQAGHELHALPLNNWLTVTDVTVPENPVLMTEDSTLDLGPAGIPRVLRFTNSGPRALPALSLTGLSRAPFTADVTAVPSLAPGASAEVTVSFSAFNPGTYSAEMRISLEGVNHHTHTHRLLLKGRKVGLEDTPSFSLQPQSFLTLADGTFPGSIVTFKAEAFNHTSALWFKDYPSGEAAVGSGLTLQRNTSTDHAGIYTLLLGDVPSQNAVLAIVQPASGTFQAVKGNDFWINCTVTPATLSGMLTYQWFRDGVPLTDVDRRRGSRSSRLELDALQLRDQGDYSCEVTLHAPDGDHVLNHGTQRLIVLNNPQAVLPEDGELSHFVGQAVSYQLNANQPVDRFAFQGLPPGLKAQANGLITGIPTKALPIDPATGLPRPYQITVTATNAAGTGTSSTFKWYIHAPLPPGTYEGLLGRIEAPGIDKNLGSRVKLVFSPAGSLTGTLLHRGRTYRFAGGTGLTVGVAPDVAGRIVRIDIPQLNQLPPFQLFITPSEEQSGLTLDTRDGNGSTGFLQKQITPQQATLIYYHKLYTASLSPAENAAADGFPSGSSFLSATVTKTGAVNWKGKLADGTAVTGSSLWTGYPGDIALPVHVDLYKTTGSLHGWLTFTPRLLIDSGALSTSFLGGVLNWSKAAQPETSKDRVYKNGFAPHDLFVQGREYHAPAKGEVILGLNPVGENAHVYLTGPNVPHNLGGLNGDRTLPITITPAHKPLNFTDIASPRPLKNLTISAATGTYKGTLLFPHENPKLNRTAPFEGVILSPDGPAPGFFLLPDLPAEDQPASALKTTPIQSGLIRIQPIELPEP